MLLHAFGDPTAENAPSVVFNGDYVDRGEHQLEVTPFECKHFDASCGCDSSTQVGFLLGSV